jgi:hypothetical protein
MAATRRAEVLDAVSVCWDCGWNDKEPGVTEETAADHSSGTAHKVTHRSLHLVTFGGTAEVTP